MTALIILGVVVLMMPFMAAVFIGNRAQDRLNEERDRKQREAEKRGDISG